MARLYVNLDETKKLGIFRTSPTASHGEIYNLPICRDEFGFYINSSPVPFLLLKLDEKIQQCVIRITELGIMGDTNSPRKYGVYLFKSARIILSGWQNKVFAFKADIETQNLQDAQILLEKISAGAVPPDVLFDKEQIKSVPKTFGQLFGVIFVVLKMRLQTLFYKINKEMESVQ